MRLSFVTENPSLKLFSLAVSILLFLFVSVESATPVDVDFRIEYRTADDITIVGEAPTVVHTTLQGPWATFRSFELNDLKPVLVDLTSAGPGTMRYSLDSSEVQAPGGMSVVAIRPSEIEITLDRKVERHVPVQVDLIGRPAFGFELESVEATPRRVRVTGPVSVMQSIDFVYTRPIDLEGREESFAIDVDLRSPPAPLRLKDKRVAVEVNVTEEFVTRPFDNLPVVARDLPKGTRITPAHVSLKLEGPRTIIEAVDADSIEAFVDIDSESELSAQAVLEKAVKARGNPERTQWVGSAPRVQVQLPKVQSKRAASNRR